MNQFDYTFGIEEEYFLGSAASGNLATRVPRRLLSLAQSRLGETVTAELLQSQIEIASPIFHDVAHALSAMTQLRTNLAEVVATQGLRLVAASTYPLGTWRGQAVTEKPRYDELMSDFRIIGQRNLVCGMHVHVAVPPGIDRVMLMNRVMPWLPLFLALSTSSPFWSRHITGLLSYRQAVYDEWPRSGVPDFFTDEYDYQAFVDVLRKAQAVQDSSYFWWAIRPALKYPTLELRIADVCTRVEDGVALAALFRCLVATLVEEPLTAVHTTHTRRLIDENRWRAKRDGIAARFIVEADGSQISMPELVAQLLRFVDRQAGRLGCKPALRQIDRILDAGTSAHAQLRLYNEQRAAGKTQTRALHAVVDWLATTTAARSANAAAALPERAGAT